MLLEAARQRGTTLSAGLDRRGVRIDRGGVIHGGFAATTLEPVQRYQDRCGSARVSSYFHTYALETVICRGSNNYGPRQYPEKLIPSHDPERARRRLSPRLRRRPKRAQLAVCRGLWARHWPCRSLTARPGRSTTAAVPTSREPGRCKQIIELTGADESLIEYVTDRPGHDRRYSLSSDKLKRLGLGTSVSLRRGHLPYGATGIATTPGGGSRFAPAHTASTTSSITADP